MHRRSLSIHSAGIAPKDIDGVFVSLFNNGFSKQDFPSSLVLNSVPELRFTQATRFENACASGSAGPEVERQRREASVGVPDRGEVDT